MEIGRFAFLSPSPFGGLWATYDDHLRLIRKHVVDFRLVLIERFSLGVMAEALRANWRNNQSQSSLDKCKIIIAVTTLFVALSI